MLKLPPKYRDREILYRRLILFTLSIGLLVVYAGQIFDFIARAIWVCFPFIVGAILAFVLNTFCSVIIRLSGRFLHWKCTEKNMIWYRILTVLIIVLFLVLLFSFIIPQVLSSVDRLMRELPVYYAELYQKVYSWTGKVPVLRAWMDDHQEILSDAPVLLSQLAGFVTTGGAGSAFGSLSNVISNTFSWLWTLFLSLVFAIIAFFNTKQFLDICRLIAGAWIPERFIRPISSFTGMVSRIFAQYIGGSVLECIILASLVSVFGLIFRIPYAVLTGVTCGIFALVPMFGATAGAILCSLFLLIESPGKAITFLIMFICIQQVEGNFIYPNVVGKSVGLPPMFVVVSITIGASLAGIIGMILSIPVASVIYEMITQQAKKRMAKRKDSARERPKDDSLGLLEQDEHPDGSEDFNRTKQNGSDRKE